MDMKILGKVYGLDEQLTQMNVSTMLEPALGADSSTHNHNHNYICSCPMPSCYHTYILIMFACDTSCEAERGEIELKIGRA
jgi:hypothetical protein